MTSGAKAMFIRLIGLFQVQDADGRDHTPRGAKARALLALLCRTPGHCRPRRWLESRLWSDRGQEQASGSLRQALTELRKSLGPLAVHLHSDRDSVALTEVTTDIDRDPVAARMALAGGREFLEGNDVIDAAFCAWLTEERQRLARQLGGATLAEQVPGRSQPFTLRIGALPEGIGADMARDLAQAVARLAAEHLLRDGVAAFGSPAALLPDGLDLEIEGAWSQDRAHLKVRLVAQSDRKTIWSQRLIATRPSAEEGQGAASALIFETTDAPIM
ncbi:hypothetical protein [Rhodobacter calidifons]|uniref:DNA-binding SARP family transcriptional activator n=1 Tax=Rhodobacter calidifons TaxID=2715277 RepID=A0ABX0G402_9RHOB|nr:hypothetical protein [Rhodobacter calidifons]NHB75702.1 hypothetical protein [Rhodobacter calidifons]